MKKILVPSMILPIIIVVVGSMFEFFKNTTLSIVQEGSSLLQIENQTFIFGSVFSPLFFFIVLSLVGFALVNSLNQTTKNIGMSLYSAAFISSLLTSYALRERYIDILDDGNFALALGGYLLFTGAILGLILVLVLTSWPIVDDIVNKYYKVNESKEVIQTEE